MFNDFSSVLIEDLGWTLLHFVWQGCLIAVGAAGLLMALRRTTASTRYLVAVGAMSLMAVAPVLTMSWLASGDGSGVRHVEKSESGDVERPLQTESSPRQFQISEVPDPAVAETATASAVDIAEIGVVRRTDASSVRPVADELLTQAKSTSTSIWNRDVFTEHLQPLLPVVVGVWLVGVCLLSARMLWGWLGVRRLRRRGIQPASEALRAMLDRLMEKLAISKPVRLVESALVEVPTVIGWLKPVVLLPVTALSGLSTDQLEALLAHELAHVRRNDYLINLLQSVVETLLFYHPAVWWLSRRIRIEREHCCDDLAVQVCGDELSYAKALVALEELRGPQTQLAMSADGGSLLGRVSRLLRTRERTAPVPSFGLPALSLVLVGLMAFATANGGWARLPVASEEESNSNHEVEAELIASNDETPLASESFNEAPTKVAVNDADGTAGVPSPQSLIDLMTESSRKLSIGRMRVEIEKLTDQSWISGKTDQPPVKTNGKVVWRNDGKQWRVDYDGELPNSGKAGKVTTFPELWSTGFDGERFYDFLRDRQSLVIGATHQTARSYEPPNLFWNPTNGGVEAVLDVLRKPGVTVTNAKLGELEGYRVERVLENNGKWKWSAFVCPSRNYLTLELQQFLNEQLAWECKLSDLAEVQTGVWYPQTIHRASYNWSKEGQRSIAWQHDFKVTEFKLGVEEAQSWPTYAERTAGFAHPTLKVPYGIHINDLTRGAAYFNDPWWSELEPILKAKHGWPKTSLLPLADISSRFAKAPDMTFRFQSGGALPKFETKDGSSLVWTAGPDNEKAQPKVTLVLFWAPWDERSVKVLVSAKRLHDELSAHGLQIVAVQDPARSAEATSAFMKSLALPFTSMVDEFPEAEGELGKNTIRKTLGVRGLPAGCLLNHEHRVVAIDDGNKMIEQILELLSVGADGTKERAFAERKTTLKLDEPLTDEIGRAAAAEWKQLVTQSEPRTHIKGRVLNAQDMPIAAVVVEIEPRLKLARGGYGGITIYPDYKATRTVRTNAGGVFDAQSLPKGSYEVRIKAGGLASRKIDVAVGPGQPGELGDVVLLDPDTIAGRVVDEQRQPVKGARVEVRVRHPDLSNLNITTRSPGAMPKTVTAEDGRFQLLNLEVGRYTLEVDAVGHEKVVVEKVPLGKADLKVWLDAYPEPLQRKVSLKAAGMPLQDALKALCEQAKVEHELDGNGLKQGGLTKNMPVMIEVQDMPLGDALEVLLAPFEEEGPLGFGWDGKQLFVSLKSVALKHRLQPFETIKGPPRERYAQLDLERATNELEDARRANSKNAGTIAPLVMKKLEQVVEMTRTEHELVLHEASQVIGQSITPEFMKKANDLLIKRVETFLAVNKTLLEIANDENQTKPGSVKEQELQRLKKQIEDLEKDLARLTGKPQANAPFNRDPLGSESTADGDGKNAAQRVAVKRADEVGMLRGQIKIEGRLPQAPPHAVYDRVKAFLPWRLKDPTDKQIADYEADRAKNPAKYEPRKVRDESLLVSPRGELANAVVYLEKAPKDWKPTPIANASRTLRAEADRFAPRVLLLRVGQSLELAQADSPRVDNFHWRPVRNTPFNIIAEKDKPFVVPAKDLRQPEKAPMQIRSDINPWKTAYVLLLDHPFMAVTDAEGRFEINDLPRGTHEFKVWHERSGYLDKKLAITINDQPVNGFEMNFPAERVVVRADSFMKDALNRSELSLSANWRDGRNEFSLPLKPDQKVIGTIELHLKNTSDKPVTVKVPSGAWQQRRETKLRDMTITLDSAADAKATEITIPANDVISLTQSDVKVDLTGVDAGYWQLQLKTPLHAVGCYLPFWLDGIGQAPIAQPASSASTE